MRRRHSHLALGTVLILLALLIGSCGDDDDGGNGGGSPLPEPEANVDSGCEEVPDYPVRGIEGPEGFVVACLTPNLTAMHLRNVSAHVLRVSPGTGVSDIQPTGIDQDPGVQAAYRITGAGYSPSVGDYVLPLGGSLLASGTGPVQVRVTPDLVLTAEANSARYVTNWIVSRFQSPGRRILLSAQSCAQTAANFAQSGAYVADVLRGALDTAQCSNALANAIREAGQNPTVELPRARSAILAIASPVAEDRLIQIAANILGR
jgi:hypothetical protein